MCLKTNDFYLPDRAYSQEQQKAKPKAPEQKQGKENHIRKSSFEVLIMETVFINPKHRFF